jgi:hypothetical protein
MPNNDWQIIENERDKLLKEQYKLSQLEIISQYRALQKKTREYYDKHLIIIR